MFNDKNSNRDNNNANQGSISVIIKIFFLEGVGWEDGFGGGEAERFSIVSH